MAHQVSTARSDLTPLSGGRAFVTGGASGIGLAVARRLVTRGTPVVIADRCIDARELPAPALTCDVTDPISVVDAVRAATDELGGPPDLLVLSAGVYSVAALEDTTFDEWNRVHAVNLRGVFLTATEVHRALRGQSGAFVLVSSIAATHTNTHEPSGAYGASKAALIALTRQMAAEWAPTVRVNAVAPGVIDTPMLSLQHDVAASSSYLADRVPLRRFGTADEVAQPIEFLLSDAAAYITGTTIQVDGGASIT